MDIKAMGARIARYRNRAGHSMERLASISGVSKNAINDLENGRGNPTIKTLEALGKALHAPISDLIGEHDVTATRLDQAALRELIEAAPDELLVESMFAVLHEFASVEPERRAATLAVLFGNPSISEPYLRRSKPQAARTKR